MRYEKYTVIADEYSMTFEFLSEGPRGLIRKRIQYQPTDRENVYNLAFGDVSAETDDFDDSVVSQNDDAEKVLATVASTIYVFTDRYPKAIIFAIGSTSTRTRLYRIGISKNLEEFRADFDIYGLTNDYFWVKYEKNESYIAFYVKKKI